MKTAEHIIETVDKLVRKYHTRDPYELCQLLGIKIHYYDLQKKLKGFFYYQSRQKNIVIDHNVNGILERILVAHELGHAVLHTKIAMMHGFQEMEVFDDRSIEENEANFFAAELLLEDGKVLECLSEHTFFETAKMLYVPAALLDYKFSLLHEKGDRCALHQSRHGNDHRFRIHASGSPSFPWQNDSPASSYKYGLYHRKSRFHGSSLH